MIGRETMRLAGRSHVKETVNGFSFLVSPTAFFQTNVDAADVIVRLVLEAVPEADAQRVLDLYAGSGLFTVPLAARGHLVTAVEENRQAMEDADANLRLNRVGTDSVRLHRARVEDALPRLRATPFDVAILDPPRQGCHAGGDSAGSSAACKPQARGLCVVQPGSARGGAPADSRRRVRCRSRAARGHVPAHDAHRDRGHFFPTVCST